MELRGRPSKYQDLENQICGLLSNEKNEIGFRQFFSKLGIDPQTKRAHISKSTLSSALKFLLSQNKIRKTQTGKYTITPGEDHMSNVRRLRWLLDNLDDIVTPSLKSNEKAYIGMKLWTVIFQNEFHPAQEFRQNHYIDISNKTSKSRRKKLIKEFLESKKYFSIFEDQMYKLFFDFCGQFSATVLEKAIAQTVSSVPNQIEAIEKKSRLLAIQFQKDIFVKRSMRTTYYGIAFCNILSQTDPKKLNEETLELFKRKNIFPAEASILNLK